LAAGGAARGLRTAGNKSCPRKLEREMPGNLRQNNVMSPEIALGKHIEIYRRMTREARLALALRLHALASLACEGAREGIRARNPALTEPELEARLRERLALLHRG
jgi:hypothetical protein